MPGDLAQVIAWYEAGTIPVGTTAFGVDEALRAQNPEADDEELEYLATVAAHAAVTRGRPAVVALDVSHEPRGELAVDVPMADWAAVFVDDLQWFAVAEIGNLR